MPLYCSAYGCKERFVKGGPITFHSFPKDETRRKLWTLQLRRKDFTPSSHSKICSKHFTDDCYDTTKFGGTWLKPTAVPTIFDFPDYVKTRTEWWKPSQKDLCSSDESSPSTSDISERSKRLCYLGDFRDEDISPRTAKTVLKIARGQICKYKKKVASLENKNRRLTQKITSLNELLDELKNKSIISDEAYSALGAILAPRTSFKYQNLEKNFHG